MNRVALLADSLTGQAISTGKPSLVTDDRCQAAAAALGADTGPLVVVPLAAGEHVRGALMLGGLATRPGFTETDLDMAASFAGHAAVALELAQARMTSSSWPRRKTTTASQATCTTMSSRSCSPSA